MEIYVDLVCLKLQNSIFLFISVDSHRHPQPPLPFLHNFPSLFPGYVLAFARKAALVEPSAPGPRGSWCVTFIASGVMFC